MWKEASIRLIYLNHLRFKYYKVEPKNAKETFREGVRNKKRWGFHLQVPTPICSSKLIILMGKAV